MIYTSQDFVFNPADFRDAKFVSGAALDDSQLQDGEVIIAVDRLALTANTISYGIAGKSGMIRYLDSFPTDAPYARMPFWGFGDIVASAHDDLPVGERLYGFYPLSTYLLTKMDKVNARKCADITPARDTIPEFYREYARSFAEPGYHPDFDDMQSLLRPVIGTSFLLEHYISRHNFYGAKNIVITSASSKTAFGFGHFLTNGHKDKCRAIGLTSARNKAFVEKTGCYDEVLTYDEIDQLPLEASVVFDMAGNEELRSKVHQHLGDFIAYSGIVGATHWEEGGRNDPDLPGPAPVFWSGPDEIALLSQGNNSKNILSSIGERTIGIMIEAAGWLKVKKFTDSETIKAAYLDMLDGKMSAEDGIIFGVKKLTA
ncbi:MAG: DUF2855 family protein [Alphaproteobacteria bacterium]|nr:DUF2855 family protein [Alphaproteobacteria bacterium]